jgi:hypothetical protein
MKVRKDNITDFIISWREYDKISPDYNPNWFARFRDAGYYSVSLNHSENIISLPWKEIHEWCYEQFDDHYFHTEGMFFFECEQDAHWFALRWG